MEEGSGDSKIIEDFNHHLQHQGVHEALAGLNAKAAQHAKLENCGVLEQRANGHIKVATIDQEDWERAGPATKLWQFFFSFQSEAKAAFKAMDEDVVEGWWFVAKPQPKITSTICDGEGMGFAV